MDAVLPGGFAAALLNPHLQLCRELRGVPSSALSTSRVHVMGNLIRKRVAAYSPSPQSVIGNIFLRPGSTNFAVRGNVVTRRGDVPGDLPLDRTESASCRRVKVPCHDIAELW